MSKALVDDAEKIQWRKPEELKSDFGVDFHPGTVSLVVAVDITKLTISSLLPKSIPLLKP